MVRRKRPAVIVDADIARLKKVERLAARPGSAGEGEAALQALARLRARLGIAARKPRWRRVGDGPVTLGELVVIDPCTCGSTFARVMPARDGGRLLCEVCRSPLAVLTRGDFAVAAPVGDGR